MVVEVESTLLAAAVVPGRLCALTGATAPVVAGATGCIWAGECLAGVFSVGPCCWDVVRVLTFNADSAQYTWVASWMPDRLGMQSLISRGNQAVSTSNSSSSNNLLPQRTQ